MYTDICIQTYMHKHTRRHANTNANTGAHTFAVHGQCISTIKMLVLRADELTMTLLRVMMPINAPTHADLLQHIKMLKANFINSTNLYREAPDSSFVHQHRNDVPPSPGCHMFKFIYCKDHDRKIDRQTDQRMDTLDRSSHRDLRRHLVSLL